MKHETSDTSFHLASSSCPLVFDTYADVFSAGDFYTVNLFVFFSETNLDSAWTTSQGKGIHELCPVSPILAQSVTCALTGCILYPLLHWWGLRSAFCLPGDPSSLQTSSHFAGKSHRVDFLVFFFFNILLEHGVSFSIADSHFFPIILEKFVFYY